jgi:hypothetical protein
MTMNETHGITEDAVTGNAETGQNTDSQVENTTKTFTQDEVNELIGKRVAQVNKKFDGVDVDEYKALKGLKEQIEEEQLIKKEDFNSVLKKHKDRSDAEVSRLRTELETIKIDGALINASSKAKAVSPEHVAQLLRKNIKLAEDGNVVVTDSDGKTRYTDNADLMSVDHLVEEFLSSNQYFKAAGPSGSGSSGNTNNATQQSLDLAQLDMNNPEHRKLYTEMKKQGKV